MKKFFLYGCLGCGGIFVLFVVTVLTIAWVGGKRADFADATARYDPISVSDLAASADLSDAPRAAVNRVTLTLMGIDEIKIRPCDPGAGLAVDARYDRNRIEFSETMREEADGTWDYAVEMTGQGSGWMRVVRQIVRSGSSELNLCLPRDAPIEFVMEARDSGLEADIGSLWLTGVDVSLERVGGVVQFGEPLREPADHLTFRTNMSGGVLARVGNASPAELNLESRFSGVNVDMSGAWKRDALITIDGSGSGATFTVPRSVRVAGVPDLPLDADGTSETTPTLTFAPGTNFDDVTVTRR